MPRLTGLFQRGGSYYLRIVLPLDHPLREQHRNGRWVQTLGPCGHREAVIKGTIKRAEVLGGYKAPLGPSAVPASPPAAPATLVYLRQVYLRWSKAKPRTPDTIATCGLALKLFEEQTGNPPIQQLTRAQGEAFRTWLQTLPTSSKTARDRLVWVRALLRYAAEDLEWIHRNPWDRLDMQFKTESRRRPWTSSELNLLFSQDLYTAYKLPKDKKAGADAAYWIPLLGMYTGARLGELAQLHVGDVQTRGDITLLSITDGAEGQSVKTDASVRLVPVHRELIRLGFLDYVAALRGQGVVHLWPRLPARKGKAGGYFSQWFGDFRKALGLGKHPDFHCFRHSARTAMAEASVPADVIDLLLGHEVKGSTGSRIYTHRPLGTLKAAIETICGPPRLPIAMRLPVS